MRLSRGSRVVTGWLAADEHSQYERLPLVGVYEDEQGWRKAGAPEIVLERPQQDVRGYNSEISVVRDGREVRRHVVEANRPLHYGGYHFYQADFDHDHHRYTVLRVVSDAGLPAVYAGFAMLAAGIAWRLWIRPGLRRGKEQADTCPSSGTSRAG